MRPGALRETKSSWENQRGHRAGGMVWAGPAPPYCLRLPSHPALPDPSPVSPRPTPGLTSIPSSHQSELPSVPTCLGLLMLRNLPELPNPTKIQPELRCTALGTVGASLPLPVTLGSECSAPNAPLPP